MKRSVSILLLAALLIVSGCLPPAFSCPVHAAEEESIPTKELNFVFLHGAGGNSCSFQLLADSIVDRLPGYISEYERKNPNTKVVFDTMLRCYPNDVDNDTWANNIAESIKKYFNKKNLILIGHSMGGKTALYAVAKNVGDLADRVAMVVTINSPIKRLIDYYYAGGETALEYWGAKWMLSDKGVLDSIANYDSTKDGRWVAANKHWLAFISAEKAPLSRQFDFGGVDPLPRNMDDIIIPFSAQYAEGADVIYYGEHGHSDFSAQKEVAGFIADQILNYIFGKPVECSFLARSGTYEHKANWLPVTVKWQDAIGEMPAYTGKVFHKNESYTRWQEWVDVVGEPSSEIKRSSYLVDKVKSLPWLTGIKEVRWFNPDNPEDCRLYIRTRAAPRCSIQAEWSINHQGLLPQDIKRDRYEVEISTGTPLTGIEDVSWLTTDPRDLRLRIWSRADGPFRWFKVKWRVYLKEPQLRKVIDEIP